MFEYLSDDRTYFYLVLMFLFIIVPALMTYFQAEPRSRWDSKKYNYNLGEAFFSVLSVLFILWPIYSYGISSRKISLVPEQIGGYVTKMWTVDGEHEESEEVCTGSGDNRSCHREYYTVYHREFFVENSTGDWWEGWTWKQRVNKPNQYSEPYEVPAYYANSYVGKPISLSHNYKDYRTAVHQEEYISQYNALVGSGLPDFCPETPYVKLNEIQTIRTVFSRDFGDDVLKNRIVSEWNFEPRMDRSFDQIQNLSTSEVPLFLDSIFAYGGSKYQNDTVVVFMNSIDARYSQLCMAKWNRGVKNAMYLFIFGKVSNGEYYPTSSVLEISVPGEAQNSDFVNTGEKSNAVLKMVLEQELDKSFSDTAGMPVIRENVLRTVLSNVEKYWNRSEMSNFKKDEFLIVPTDLYISAWFTIVAIGNLILNIFFLFNNIEDL